MFERPGIERAILSLCKNNKAFHTISSEVKEEYFLTLGHRIIFCVIMHLKCNENVEKLDSMAIYSTITQQEAKEEIDSLGGLEYIQAILNAVIFNNTELYIKQLREAYMRDYMYKEAYNLKLMLEDTETSPKDSMLNFENKIGELYKSENNTNVVKVGTGLKERMKERLNNPKEVFGYKIGWKNFDKIGQGLQSNDLIVVVGESKTGKSTLLTNWAERLCSSGLSGLYIDTEMEYEEFEDRLVSIVSGVPFEEIRNGKYGTNTEYGNAEDKMTAVENATTKVENMKLYHVYMPDFNFESVSAEAKFYKEQHNIDFLVFDYIKLPNSDSKNINAKEYERLGVFTTCLKDLAGKLRIPVITACQANRTQMGNTEPDAGSIQGSYRILQLASKLYFIRNKTEYELTQEGNRFGNQVLHIKYQRHGGTGTNINIMFSRPILRMQEVS